MDAESPFWVYRHLGFALSQLGDLEGAVAAYEKAVELNPEDGAAQGLLGKITITKCDIEEESFSEQKALDLIQPQEISVEVNGSIKNIQPVVNISKNLTLEEIALEIAETLFDDEFYRQQFSTTEDIKLPSKEFAFRHFLEQASNSENQLAAPTKWFFPEIYRDIYSNVMSPNENPFLHYLVDIMLKLQVVHLILSIPLNIFGGSY